MGVESLRLGWGFIVCFMVFWLFFFDKVGVFE